MHVAWDNLERFFVFVFAREKGIIDFVVTIRIVIYSANFEGETYYFLTVNKIMFNKLKFSSRHVISCCISSLTTPLRLD
jgi:hypothetical protein